MLNTMISSLVVYISTSIDYLIILLVIFASVGKEKFLTVLTGQYLGIGFLVFVSLIVIYFLNFVPEDWIIGLLGLIPLYLGIRFAIFGEGDEVDEEDLEENIRNNRTSSLVWTVTLITIASGGDNLGIYIPYFTSLTFNEIIMMLGIFALSIFVLNYLSFKLATLDMINEIVEKYERVIVPVVFIGLGVFILIENGTIQHLLGL
ncbi:CadD family cadmium resistance transporter [Aerococcaceae bacterium 50-4]